MSREVLVADAKPCRVADFGERVEDPEGVALDAIPRLVVEHACEAVDDRVDVRTDQESPELIVVRGVGDDSQFMARPYGLDPCGQRRPTSASGQDDDLQRNRSSAAGRMRSRPEPVPSSSSPRTITTGVRSVLPITSPALEAMSSATASTVACSGWPASSRVPRRSTRTGRPATPSATLTMPNPHGRPNVSETITPN